MKQQTPPTFSIPGLTRRILAIAGNVLAIAAAVLAVASPAFGQTESPVQSTARPFGLDIVGPVQLAGSDERSADFQTNVLPIAEEFVNVNLNEKVPVANATSLALDPSQLDLLTTADVRVYFVGEGAGYHNTLGFNTSGSGISSGDPQLIFPDASASNSYLSSGADTRKASEPLLAGDFVELGTLEAGTHLDFFLIANGANGGTNVYSTDQSINPDGINHVVTHAFALEDSPYLLIGFEDLFGGGDNDFNDLVFVLDIGIENIQYLAQTASLDSPVVGAPEPRLSAILMLAITIGIVIHRQRD